MQSFKNIIHQKTIDNLLRIVIHKNQKQICFCILQIEYLIIIAMKAYIFVIFLLVRAYSNKIFLFGSVLHYDNNKAYQKIIEVVGKPTRKDCNKNWITTDCPKVAVITSASIDSQSGDDEYNSGDDQQAGTKAFFQSLGMVPIHVSVHIDNYQKDTDVLTYQGEVNYYTITRADIIYFNGGDQSRHVRCWLNENTYPNTISALIKRRVQLNQVVIIGVSAGTAFQSFTTFGGGSSFGNLYFSRLVGLAPKKIGQGLQDLRNGTDCLQSGYNGAKMQGFGLIKQFQVDTHFDARGRLGRLIPAAIENKMKFGVGIDESACVYYEDGVITVYGTNGVFIADLSSALDSSNKYLKVKNIKLHYLTEGDRFIFSQNKYQTTKQLISNPSYVGFLDSPDILSAYQTTKLVLRLIDQTGTVNEGQTKIPQDEEFPSTTPKYSFTFYKDASTKGYKTGNLKSAFNVNLDISAQTRNLQLNYRK